MRQGIVLWSQIVLASLASLGAPSVSRGTEPEAVREIRSQEVVGLRQIYTPWQYEKERSRYVSFYFFRPDPRKEVYSRQIAIFYPEKEEGDGRNQYVYYFNIDRRKYWGRCCTAYHDAYDPKRIKWSLAKEDEWGEVEAVDIAVPQSIDNIAIAAPPPAPKVPDPPFDDKATTSPPLPSFDAGDPPR